MLDIDLGTRQKNYETWAYSPGNGPLSSKAFIELNRKLFNGPLREPKMDTFASIADVKKCYEQANN